MSSYGSPMITPWGVDDSWLRGLSSMERERGSSDGEPSAVDGSEEEGESSWLSEAPCEVRKEERGGGKGKGGGGAVRVGSGRGLLHEIEKTSSPSVRFRGTPVALVERSADDSRSVRLQRYDASSTATRSGQTNEQRSADDETRTRRRFPRGRRPRADSADVLARHSSTAGVLCSSPLARGTLRERSADQRARCLGQVVTRHIGFCQFVCVSPIHRAVSSRDSPATGKKAGL